MARIGSPISTKPLLAFFFFFFFFFNNRELDGWYLLVEETMVVWHVILTKRETRVGVGREIARTQYEKMWKDEKTQEKKMHTMNICGLLILVMIEDARVNKKKIGTGSYIGVSL
jgi:hypothetical protein